MSATPPEPATGEAAHFRSLEALYRSAPINGQYRSELKIVGPGRSEIRFQVEETSFHAAGAAHGTIYFKMLDDAAFYAANSLISDRFLLTTSRIEPRSGSPFLMMVAKSPSPCARRISPAASTEAGSRSLLMRFVRS